MKVLVLIVFVSLLPFLSEAQFNLDDSLAWMPGVKSITYEDSKHTRRVTFDSLGRKTSIVNLFEPSYSRVSDSTLYLYENDKTTTTRYGKMYGGTEWIYDSANIIKKGKQHDSIFSIDSIVSLPPKIKWEVKTEDYWLICKQNTETKAIDSVQYFYDEQNRIYRKRDVMSLLSGTLVTEMLYHYNANGQLVWSRFADRPGLTEYIYNEEGKLVMIKSPFSVSTVNYTF